MAHNVRGAKNGTELWITTRRKLNESARDHVLYEPGKRWWSQKEQMWCAASAQGNESCVGLYKGQETAREQSARLQIITQKGLNGSSYVPDRLLSPMVNWLGLINERVCEGRSSGLRRSKRCCERTMQWTVRRSAPGKGLHAESRNRVRMVHRVIGWDYVLYKPQPRCKGRQRSGLTPAVESAVQRKVRWVQRRGEGGNRMQCARGNLCYGPREPQLKLARNMIALSSSSKPGRPPEWLILCLSNQTQRHQSCYVENIELIHHV